MVSEEEKKKSNEQTNNKGKIVVNHPPIEHFPYSHALSKKECSDTPFQNVTGTESIIIE